MPQALQAAKNNQKRSVERVPYVPIAVIAWSGSSPEEK